MRKKSGPKLSGANAAELKSLGLKRKHYIFPRQVALAIEAQAEKERRFETQILIDAFGAYKREFEAFLAQVAAAKKSD